MRDLIFAISIAALAVISMSTLVIGAEWGKQGQNVISPTTLQTSITTNKSTFTAFSSVSKRRNAMIFAAFSTQLKAQGTW